MEAAPRLRRLLLSSTVEMATMIGSWRGEGVKTGHPMDGLLERFGWHGKRLTGPDGAHPLVSTRRKVAYSA
jgi:GXWXG protein